MIGRKRCAARALALGPVLGLVLAGLASLAGCGSGSDSTAPTPSPTSATPSAFAGPCPSGGKQLKLHGPHGTTIEGAAIGPGRSDAVVLLHEAGSGYCNGWDYAVWLATHEHVQVVLVNRCGYGRTTCTKKAGKGAAQIAATTQPAIDYARAHGARHVTLVGASSGASDAVQAAASVHGIRAVVALSPDRADTGQDSAHFDRDRLPTLMAYAPQDSLCPPKSEHRWFHRIPATTKHLAVADKPYLHGWDLVLDDESHPLDFAATVSSWIHGDFGN